MRFLVISDTHRHLEKATDLIVRLHEEIDGVWHLGDNYHDFELLSNRFALPFRLAFQGVPGNCDAAAAAPARRVIPVEGHRVFMTHGHVYGVSASYYGSLNKMARSAHADVVLFGHTHVPLLLREEGILYLNPGSLSEPRGGSKTSYAILTLESGKEPEAKLFNY